MNMINLNHEAYIKFREKGDYNDKEFWYADTEFAIKDNPVILIDELYVLKGKRNIGLGTTLLKEVIMNNPNTIILVKSGLGVSDYHKEPTDDEYIMVLNKLDKFFTERGFVNINKYTKSYEYHELYVYTGNDMGMRFFEEIKSFYNK